MRRAIAYCCVLIAVVVLPAYGQQRVDAEAELKAAVPYARMLFEDPTLTLEEYNAAIRAVVGERVGMPTHPFATIPQVFPRTASPPSLVGTDGTYLGVLSNNRYDPNSVSNPYGKYGSRYSPTSINNPYSTYGSRFSPSSVTNPYAISPPTPLAPLALPSLALPSLELPSLELPPLYPR